MALSKDEVESIRHEDQKVERNIEENTIKPKKKFNKKIIFISIVFVLIVGGIGFGYANTLKPSALDGFAQCLTEEGAVMYGASFCQYSHAQQGMFGNSERFLDIRDFTEDSNVKVTPTWKINGAYYQNVQTFDRLTFLTGCAIR
jgi:hypothetical protein